MSDLKIGSIFSMNENGEETVKIEHVLRLLGNSEDSEVMDDNAGQLLAALQIQETPSDQIKCKNCTMLFPADDFKYHVCEYDENHQLINAPKQENIFSHPVFALMQKNQNMIQSILDRSQNSFDCPVCQRKFARESSYDRHLDRHVGEILPIRIPKLDFLLGIRCMCGQLFDDEDEALDHVQKHHFCEREEFVWKYPHSNSILDEEDDMVPNLFKNLSVEEKEERDSKAVTFPAILESLKPLFLNKVHQCELCDNLYSDFRSLIYHTSQHHPCTGFSCNSCDIRGLNLKQLALHRRTECPSEVKLLDLPCSLYCNVCYDEFKNVERLIEHRYKDFHFFPRMDFSQGKLIFTCEYCLMTFPLAENLVNHYNAQHKPKGRNEGETESPKEPKQGGIAFTSTKYRQYLCEVCGKSYTQSSHLWQHLRFHKGVKPFVCTVAGCDRKFTIRPDLNDHIRKCHTGERPYHCTLCGKRFLTGSVYYQHRLIHRGERRYGCTECPKRFYRADALKNHSRIHSGEKPFACPHCPKSFRQRGDRDKHIKARHPGLLGISPKRKPPKFSFGKGRTKNDKPLLVVKEN